jgi:hypothetical protein
MIIGGLIIVVIGVAVAGIGIWRQSQAVPTSDNRSVPTRNATAPAPPASQVKPFYTRSDVERILEAMFEVSALLQQAVTVRDAAQLFDRQWNSIILNEGDEAARLKLNAIRLRVQSLTDQGWKISNKYSHYNQEIAPVLGGMAFSEKLLHGIDRFFQAMEKIRPGVDAGTLTLLEPVRSEYQIGIDALQKWMNDAYEKERVTTERFRLVAQAPSNADKNFTTRTVRQLRALYEGRTRLQADAFMADEKGKLIDVEGIIQNIDNGMAFLQVGNSADYVECRFGLEWNAKLSTFHQGNRIKIRGAIGPSQNGAQIYLQDCEIIL